MEVQVWERRLGKHRDPLTRVLRGEVAFLDARMRGAVAAEESGRAAKEGMQLGGWFPQLRTVAPRRPNGSRSPAYL